MLEPKHFVCFDGGQARLRVAINPAVGADEIWTKAPLFRLSPIKQVDVFADRVRLYSLPVENKYK